MNAKKQQEYQTHFLILQILLLVSFMFHQTESWDDRTLAIYSILIVGILSYLPRFQNIFFAAVSLPILIRYFSTFPNLANHSNLSFLIFLFMTPVSLFFIKNPPQEKTYTAFLQTLRWLVVIMYFFTAFHKLNSDFFNPEFSCANDKMLRYIDLLPAVLRPLKIAIIPWLPLFGFLVEAAIPVGLLVPAFRRWGVLFQVGLHFLLAPLGFVDFSSLAMVLTWSFVDPRSFALTYARNVGIFSIALAISLGIFRWTNQSDEYFFLEGLLFACIYLPFIWKVTLPHISLSRLKFPQPPLYRFVVLLFFLYGFSNYLGLRTAGTFSMFSNLRTEGSTSNHLLLSSNPVKIFSFQEDTVEILEVDDRIAGFYRKMPSPGQLIPRVEFSRVLDLALKKELPNIKMKVRYNGQIFETTDLEKDENFRFEVPAWQKKLMKFRHIEQNQAQSCKW